jgi:hypothetical protein
MTKICKYFNGDPNKIKENNSCCGKDGQNCDNPFKPCYIMEDGTELP